MRISDWSSDVCSSDLDMKKLYSGFDLCAPTTSVSMTINGPAPMILAMFMNTAVDQQVEKYLKEDPQRWAEAEKRSEEHTSELQSLMRISYAVFCLKKQKQKTK